MPHTRFLGTGFAVPDRVVTNEELSRMVDTTDEWIRTRTGIQERRWVTEGETGVELGQLATERALEMAGLEASDLDAIVYATSSPDHFAPGNGVYLQHRLGLSTIPGSRCPGAVQRFHLRIVGGRRLDSGRTVWPRARGWLGGAVPPGSRYPAPAGM